MTEFEQPVAEFYAPVMGRRSVEAQRLLVRLLRNEFRQPSDLENEIMTAAKHAATNKEKR